MPADMEQLYTQRLNRYLTAMRNEKPDRVPLRPFLAEFCGRHVGYTCQDVTHDPAKALDAVIRCCKEFDWDAVVSNMVWVWTGLTQALNLRYYATPGIEIPPDTGFQYIEPPEDRAFMLADEYDALIADPTAFLYNVWLPRVSRDVVAPGQPATHRGNLALVKGGMAMLSYFMSYGPHVARMRTECGTVSAIAGILKAPLDIIADKLRGYVGLCSDLIEQPDKVRAACQALAPHLLQVALMSADPAGQVPIGFWMHRGCVPFISPEHFETIYWPTLRPIIENLWAAGHQTLFYAEGNWNAHLDAFAELPPASIVYHVDMADIVQAHRKLGGRFCISGGMPNFLLAFGKPQQVRDRVRELIDSVGADGGYIMDSSAIVQNDGRGENVLAMTEETRKYGVYPGGRSSGAKPAPAAGFRPMPMPAEWSTKTPPGVCVPWERKRKELPPIQGDAAMFERIWNNVEALGYTFIYQVLESF